MIQSVIVMKQALQCILEERKKEQHKTHCATAFSMQSCAESAYQPYADGYH